jgi:hypothetical protein
VPCPYSIIFGRDTALPSPLYHSGAAGIDIIYYLIKQANNLSFLSFLSLRLSRKFHNFWVNLLPIYSMMGEVLRLRSPFCGNE